MHTLYIRGVLTCISQHQHGPKMYQQETFKHKHFLNYVYFRTIVDVSSCVHNLPSYLKTTPFCSVYWTSPYTHTHTHTHTHHTHTPYTPHTHTTHTHTHKHTQTSSPSSSPLRINHYHFTVWPDHGVPADKTCMIQFIKRVRNIHPYADPAPLVIHCSAGVGRTGTFILLDSMLERMKRETTLNVYQTVCSIRMKRPLLVQADVRGGEERKGR